MKYLKIIDLTYHGLFMKLYALTMYTLTLTALEI